MRNPIDGSASIGRNDKSHLFLRHIVGVGVGTGELQEDVVQVPKKIVGSSMGGVGFSRYRILTKMLLEHVLGWCIDVVLAPSL